MATFAERLLSLRTERGIGRDEIGNLVGKARSSVQGWEKEGKEPSYEILCILADYFDVTTDYLLGHSDNRNGKPVALAGDVEEFTKEYEKLPSDLRNVTSATLNDFYLFLGADMDYLHSDRLALDAELMSLLREGREKISRFVEKGTAPSDVLFFSELMAMQNELKSNVSIILDRLLQADMDSVSAAKRGVSHISYLRSAR